MIIILKTYTKVNAKSLTGRDERPPINTWEFLQRSPGSLWNNKEKQEKDVGVLFGAVRTPKISKHRVGVYMKHHVPLYSGEK